VGRVVKKADTFNTTTKVYHYPQTPARVQLSLWPGGLASNAEGTIAWSGGLIDWVNAPDIKDPGYYYATFKEVTIQCYDPPSDAIVQGSKSYYYNNVAGMENNVVIGNNNTVLKSFLGTGTNMNAELPKGSKSSSGSTPSSTNDIETIPGLNDAGTGADSLRGSDSSGSSSGSGYSSGSGSGSDGSSSGSAGGAGKGGSNTFSQGDTSGNTGAAVGNVVKGSMLAIVVAFAGIMVL
jgi:beta-glucanase (GH16 family)